VSLQPITPITGSGVLVAIFGTRQKRTQNSVEAAAGKYAGQSQAVVGKKKNKKRGNCGWTLSHTLGFSFGGSIII